MYRNNGMSMSVSTLEDVKEVIAQALDLGERAHTLFAESQLFGSLPELDSFGVLELAAALEMRFGFKIDDSEFTAETFETVGTLAEFVERSRRSQGTLLSASPTSSAAPVLRRT
jgi:acyl carrier protein